MGIIVLKYLALLPLLSIGSLAQYPPCNRAQSNMSDLTFHFYTKNSASIITAEDSSIKKVEFAKSNELIVYIIGYNTKNADSDSVAIRQTYLNTTEDRNIVQVDYSKVVGPVDMMVFDFLSTYMGAAKCHLPQIAQKVVELIISIHKNHPEIKSTHVIGHSLGGQIAGRVGSLYKEIKGKLLDRVTVLDAAGPYFDNEANQVTPESAAIVDAYHTNSGFMGQIPPIGTVDFYLNNALVQPACMNNQTELQDMLLGNQATDVYFCSHQTSFMYYIASINYDRMYARRCDAIKSLIKNSNNIYLLDKNNKTALSRACEKEIESGNDLLVTKLNNRRVVLGEHLTPGVTGVYYAPVENLPSLMQYINI